MGVFDVYIAGRTLTAGEDYLALFRIAGAVEFVGYGLGNLVDSVRRAQVGVPHSMGCSTLSSRRESSAGSGRARR
jgi:hypothetical protein